MGAGRLAWGHELTPEETPYDAGLGFAVKVDKPGGFLGADALRAKKAQPRSMRCCRFEAAPDANGPYIWGGEPILVDGKYSGDNVTSGARVPIIGAASLRTMALGYVNSDEPMTKNWLAQQ